MTDTPTRQTDDTAFTRNTTSGLRADSRHITRRPPRAILPPRDTTYASERTRPTEELLPLVPDLTGRIED